MAHKKRYLVENTTRACMGVRKEMDGINKMKARGGYPVTRETRILMLVGDDLLCTIMGGYAIK